MMLARQKKDCPICGAGLEATRNLYLSDVVWDPETEEVVDYEIFDYLQPTSGDAFTADDLFAEQRIYCANDHSLAEMQAAWEGEEA